MPRRSFSILAMVLAIALAVAACAPAEEPTDPGIDPGEPGEIDEAELEPVTIRLVADHPPPPHPAAIAQQNFAAAVEREIPGSDVRIYWAGALYDIPQALEAMSDGLLEMTWHQMGKGTPVEPYSMVIEGPLLLTSIGAIANIETTDTWQMLVDRYETRHGIKIFGGADLSHAMGVGAPERIVEPEGFAGKRIRSFGPLASSAVEAWGASATVMPMGEVPSALEAGIVDGLMTSIGGWEAVRDLAPYYTSGGPGGMVGDYYAVTASTAWWGRLSPATQAVLEELIQTELIEYQKVINFCVDSLAIERYRADEPSQPGIYQLTPEELDAFANALGDAVDQYILENTPEDAHPWRETFVEEAAELMEQHPPGSHWIEETDCEEYRDRIEI